MAGLPCVGHPGARIRHTTTCFLRRKQVLAHPVPPSLASQSSAGGHAEQQAKRARLNTAFVAALEGDVLRACTATNIVWQPGSLVFGAQRPTRSIVCYGADQQRWPNVCEAALLGGVGHFTWGMPFCCHPGMLLHHCPCRLAVLLPS